MNTPYASGEYHTHPLTYKQKTGQLSGKWSILIYIMVCFISSAVTLSVYGSNLSLLGTQLGFPASLIILTLIIMILTPVVGLATIVFLGYYMDPNGYYKKIYD